MAPRRKYYPGEVTDITKHRNHVIVYGEADLETIDLENETWRFEYALGASTGNCDKTLPSSEQPVLREMLSRLRNKSILPHHAQRFKKCPLTRAYAVEEDSLLKTVKRVKRKTVRTSANVSSNMWSNSSNWTINRHSY